MPIPLTDPKPYVTPAVSEFTPDRMWVRVVTIEVDRATAAYKVRMVPCPGTEKAMGAKDAPEIVSGDLVAELMNAPDSADKLAALEAVQRVAADIVTVAAFIVSLRG